jgi:hypothetical protein
MPKPPVRQTLREFLALTLHSFCLKRAFLTLFVEDEIGV